MKATVVLYGGGIIICLFGFDVPDNQRFIKPYFVKREDGGWDAKIKLDDGSIITGEEQSK